MLYESYEEFIDSEKGWRNHQTWGAAQILINGAPEVFEQVLEMNQQHPDLCDFAKALVDLVKDNDVLYDVMHDALDGLSGFMRVDWGQIAEHIRAKFPLQQP
jgi:hypothetical protein